MSITPIQHVLGVDGGQFASATSIAIAFTGGAVGSGHAVTGFVTWGSSSNLLTSVTDDKGNSYTIDTTVNNATANQSIAIFHLENITNAPTTITANFSSSINWRRGGLAEFSGVATVSAADGATSQANATGSTSSNGQTSGNITPTVNGDLLYAVFNDDAGNGATWTVGTGFTSLDTAPNTDSLVMGHEYQVQSTAGSVAGTWTQSIAGVNDVLILALKAAGGAAAVATLGVGQGTIFVPGGRARGPVRGLSAIRAFADPIVPVAPAIQIGRSQGFLFRPGSGVTWDIKRRSAFPDAVPATQVSLTGVAGTGVAGTFTTTVAAAIAQAAGIGAAGSLTGADSSTLAPAASTGVAGQLSASVSVAFSGAIGTGVAGSIGSLGIPGLVGVAGIGVAHGITPQVSAFLSGAAGTGQAGAFSFAGAGTGNLTGVAGTGVAGGISASIQGFFAGAFGTGVAHAFTAEVDKTLTGVAGVGVAGTLTTTASGTGTLVGASGTGVAGNLNGQDGKGITGAAGTGVAHAGNAEVDNGLTGGVGTGFAGQLSTTATGNQSASIVGVSGIGVAGIITANVPAPPVATGGGNGGSLPAPKRRKTIPRPIEAPKPKVEAVLLPPSIARPTPVVARSLPPEPSLTHPLMGALAPARTPIVKPDDSEDEHAIAMLLEQQIAAERPIREAISQMLIDIMKSIETEIA